MPKNAVVSTPNRTPDITGKHLPASRSAVTTVAERRELLMNIPGIRFEDQVKRLNKVVFNRLYTTERDKNGKIKKDKKGKNIKTQRIVSPAVIVQASKQLAEQMAYNAPQQLEVETRGLLLSLTTHSADDLAKMKDVLSHAVGR